jgi:CheY-like chemotaxis protein
LPCHRGEDTAGASAADRAAEVPRGRGETVLVVDDDAAVREVVRQALSKDGYRVVAADGPHQALAIAQTPGVDLDLVVTDAVMPGMNGRDLVAALARDRPGLAVLFISGYSEEVASEASLIASGFGLLRKPLSAQALRTKVRDALARGRVTRAD